MSLRDKLLQNSTIKETSVLIDSQIFEKKDMVPTPVPMLNAALSGTIDGGLSPGLLQLAGQSKHFKTGFALLMIKSFLNKYKDGVVLFYDSEFGTPQGYFESFGINPEFVVHTPITDIEQLKFDIMKQLQDINQKDHVIIVIDSIGNLASRKEIDDALDAKSVADMTRAKQLKSLFRMVTPHLTLKYIPMVFVNHTYQEQGMFPKEIVSGGRGSYLSSNDIWVIGRQQNKTGKDIEGYHFIINIEKSRFVKEKSKIPISISWKGGINIYSGLLEVALEHGCVVKPKQGWYSIKDEDVRVREKTIINNESFWKEIFETTDLADFIEKKYKMPDTNILGEE